MKAPLAMAQKHAAILVRGHRKTAWKAISESVLVMGSHPQGFGLRWKG